MPIVFAQNKPFMIEKETVQFLLESGLEIAGFYLCLSLYDFTLSPAAVGHLLNLGLDQEAINAHLETLECVGLIKRSASPGFYRLPHHIENNDPGYVYIVGGSGYYKIGLSATPRNRFATLQTSAPFPLTLIQLITTPSMSTTEASLHSRFTEKRTKGEWFLLDQTDLDWIREHFPATTEETR